MLVGKTAPHFSSSAFIDGKIVRNFSLDSYKGKQNVLLIFYPKDFTGLCQSELVAFQERLSDFEERNTAVVACSTDTADAHAAAARMPQKKGGIEGVTFPIVSDANKTIATNYDVISGDYEYSDEGLLTCDSEMIALRGSFLIDKNGMVQHQLVNFFTLGRSVDEALRMVDALCHVQESGQGCPANWTKD
jgi:peroxiredoxin (alkyl hydroperoxide reductase subunit C)